MKVPIKYKSTQKYIEVKDLDVQGVTLEQVVKSYAKLQDLFVGLLTEIEDCYLVKKDATYLIEIEGEIKRIQDLKLLEDSELRWPLDYYEIVDGKITLNKKKVVAL